MLTVLRALRLHSGMTGTMLGAEVGRSYQWAMAVEKGRLPVPPLMQILIGGLFDISASEIFDSAGKAKTLDVPAMLISLLAEARGCDEKVHTAI